MSSNSASISALESLEPCGMRLRYKLKWNIPVERFKLPETIKDGTILARSRWQKIKVLDDLTFCLELRIKTLSYSYQMYAISIKQTSNPVCMPAEPTYAFVILDGNVYALNPPPSETHLRNKLFSVNMWKRKEIMEMVSKIQSVTVHCVICVNSDVRLVVKEDGDGMLENNLPQPRGTMSPEIEAFLFGGEIPTFTIKDAKMWIKEADELGLSDLKALYEEYLKANITKETVCEIMQIAFDCGMADLHKDCAHFLLYKCEINTFKKTAASCMWVKVVLLVNVLFGFAGMQNMNLDLQTYKET